eukprot:TRINITY_DN11313_c0_g1_i1.p1 TRINITY_DN11313_c0_g1~~TRINITY_DN11313_c0_g1_i1.p1  ORF type:complete len:455 (+),score=55.18 TRINITY_DN11313_c0_g1_i1:250-1614(+)
MNNRNYNNNNNGNNQVVERLIELCLQSVMKHFKRFETIRLPDELTLKLIRLLHRRRKLNDLTIGVLLHSELRTFDLTGCQDVNVIKIAQSCSRLSSLNLTGCLTIGDSTLVNIAKYAPQLVNLDLTYNKKITDKGIRQLAIHCLGLEKLDLSWCDRLTDESLISIGKNCSRLFELALASCPQITGQGVSFLVNSCKFLGRLDLKGCLLICNLQFEAVSLRMLNLSNCKNLSGPLDGIKSPMLQRLWLSNSNNMDDDALRTLLSKCLGLTSLDISFCRVENPCVDVAHLLTLNLSGCTKLSQSLFSRLSSGCVHLKEVYLKDCLSVDDESLDLLTGSRVTSYYSKSKTGQTAFISSLEIIDISRCNGVTDRGISLLVWRCISLKSLDASWCTQLTDQSLTSLKKAHKRSETMTLLKIFGCDKITIGAINALKEKITNLMVYFITCERDWSTLESI